MSQDIVADALNMMMNAKKAGKEELEITRYSKLLINVLEIAKKQGYVDYNLDEKEKKLKIKFIELTECMAIKPRYYVTLKTIERYMRRYLPSRNFGIIIVSTSSGLMIHSEIEEKNIGGSLIAYFF